MTTAEDIIKTVVERRKEVGMSQKDLADAAGIKQSMIARLERGKAMPQIDTLIKVLSPMGCTIKIEPSDELICPLSSRQVK